MRESFVPGYYQRELFGSLQGLRQGARPVEEYLRKVELLMMRDDVREDKEATIDPFLHGLNIKIKQEVELCQFVELKDVVHLATKVEKQMKVSSGRRYPPSPKPVAEGILNANVNHFWPEGDRPSARNMAPAIQARNEGSTGSIQWFKFLGRGHKMNQCPNKKALVL
ncbi:unnamed protein product [Linum trigynum]|uniref:Retrotransposon gag domain-containing protein n=1 Tax=Linum trigynum TaxID=586398 RepID=A0AAV2CKU8_9ROSI